MASKNPDQVLYAQATYGKEEKRAVQEVLEHPESLVGGDKTDAFEEAITDIFGKKHGIMVNSGSSALTLGIECLQLPEQGEVITPLLTFSTTVASIVQNDLIPVFVDVEMGSYQTDPDLVESAVTDDTVALMIPSLIGNIPDLKRLRDIAKEHDIYLIEDSADTVGATIDGEPTGTYTDVSTTSFYGSHIITGFGGGGMVCVNEDEHKNLAKKLRGWGRRSAVDETESIDERLNADLNGITYDHKFIFDEIGYNFHPLEASAAFGLEQLDKLDTFSDQRSANFNAFRKFFAQYEDLFILPEQRDNVSTNWMAYPVTLTENAPFDRNDLVKYLEQNSIQTRSFWSGNITRHPALDDVEYRVVGDSTIADYVMENSFVLGCHQGMGESEVRYVIQTITDFLD
jgi:CDP-6-deoxy-D-xylo-4-hexulose-3-dehydrase